MKRYILTFNFSFLAYFILIAQNSRDEIISGFVFSMESGYSIPLREEAEIDFDEHLNGIGLKVGIGYQMERFSFSLNWHRIVYPINRSDMSPSEPNIYLSGNIFGFDFGGYTFGKNKFHYLVGMNGGNHIFRSNKSTSPVSSKVIEKSNIGLRFGLGYARQLNSNLRFKADCVMDGLGLSSQKDFFGQSNLTADVLLFHFTVGAEYCFGK